MISVSEYKSDPCRKSAIPYWKIKAYNKPDNITVLHQEDIENLNQDGECRQYFRLMHRLQHIEPVVIDKEFVFKNVDTKSMDDLMEVVSIINRCYSDIAVNMDTVQNWTRAAVFDESLWVFLMDVSSKKPVALGIAEVDQEVREGALEWIQVLPEYRNRKLGQAIVNELLSRMDGRVDFVTVSGQVDNVTNPEKLYRRCGFEGNDIWNVIVKR